MWQNGVIDPATVYELHLAPLHVEREIRGWQQGLLPGKEEEFAHLVQALLELAFASTLLMQQARSALD